MGMKTLSFSMGITGILLTESTAPLSLLLQVTTTFSTSATSVMSFCGQVFVQSPQPIHFSLSIVIVKVCTFFIFFLHINVRVIEINRYVKIPGKKLHTVRAAGGTAGVKKQCWLMLSTPYRFELFFKFFVIINIFHLYYSLTLFKPYNILLIVICTEPKGGWT